MEFEKIIAGVKKNKEKSWKMLVNIYSPKIYSYTLNFSGSRDFAEEATQEVFYRIFKNIKKIKPKKHFFTKYIYTIAKHYCIDCYRKKKNNRIVQDKDYLLPKWDPDFSTKSLIWRGINKLNDEERSLIILREIEGHTYKEIAEIENLPIGTVKSKLNRTRIKLAEIIMKIKKGGENE